MDLTKLNMYTFEVSRASTKNQIKKEVAEKFKVEVLSVRTTNVKGKTKLQRTRKGYFKTSPFKKALVIVAKGQKIALFEQTSKKEAKVTTAETSEKETKEKKNAKGTKAEAGQVAKKADKSKTAEKKGAK